MTTFIPGLQLSEAFYRELVAPILRAHYPKLPYAAALLGWGSEVLGYDTPLSMDHHWGPRLLLFVPDTYDEQAKQRLSATLSAHLPYEFRGFPTNFGAPEGNGVRLPVLISDGPVSHMVEIFGLREFCDFYLDIDPYQPLTVSQWLTLPEQRLLAVTQGKVFDDATGELTQLRTQLAYYPDQVWRYLLVAQWTKISQEEAFMGRCGDVGDELGSRLMASRLVYYLMKLCFLMERQYAPYKKWFGTAFAQLQCAATLQPILNAVFGAPDWKQREEHLSRAYTVVAQMHNQLQLTPALSVEVESYYNRPYRVIHADRFAEAIQATITDPAIIHVPAPIGAIDQFVDSTDVTEHPRFCRRLTVMFDRR